jgi:hypothetical protein
MTRRHALVCILLLGCGGAPAPRASVAPTAAPLTASAPAAPAASPPFRFAWPATSDAGLKVDLSIVEIVGARFRSFAGGYRQWVRVRHDDDGHAMVSLVPLANPPPGSPPPRPIPDGWPGPGNKPTPPPTGPQIVPQVAIEAVRLSGEKQIPPPAAVRAQMATDQIARLVTTWKMCLSASGTVEKLAPLMSSGFVAYDDEIRARMKEWRYSPFKVDGRAVPVCTSVTFIYNQGAPIATMAVRPRDRDLALEAAPPWSIDADGQFAHLLDGTAVVERVALLAADDGASEAELARLRTELASPARLARRESEAAGWWSTLVGAWLAHPPARGAPTEATLRVPYGGHDPVPVKLEHLGQIPGVDGTARLRATATATLDRDDAVSMLTRYLGADAAAYAGATVYWSEIVDTDAATMKPQVRYYEIEIRGQGRRLLLRATETFFWPRSP